MLVTDDEAMAIALHEAVLALDHGDVPVGAVVAGCGRVGVAQRHNEREADRRSDRPRRSPGPSGCGRDGGTWRLDGHRLIVTLEPCAMCAGAALNSRVAAVVYGAADMKAGACLSLMNIGGDPRLNHQFEIIDGVRAEEAARPAQPSSSPTSMSRVVQIRNDSAGSSPIPRPGGW